MEKVAEKKIWQMIWCGKNGVCFLLALVLCLGFPFQTAYALEDAGTSSGTVSGTDGGTASDSASDILTLTFDLGLGRGTAVADIQAAAGTSVRLPACDARMLSDDGKSYRSFAGWRIAAPTDGEDGTLWKAGDMYTVSNPVNWTAVYEKQYVHGYTPAWVSVALKQDLTHHKFMTGGGDGLFWPDRHLTRAELAQILYQLIALSADADKTAAVPFSDVAPDAWYYNAVSALYRNDLMGGKTDTVFAPDAFVTRGELASILQKWVVPAGTPVTFPDIPASHPLYPAVQATASRGLFQGSNTGAFHADARLSRAEAVTVINRLLGRSPDMAVLNQRADLRYFPDVPTDHWAYGQVMEAAVDHVTSADVSGEQWVRAEPEKTPLQDGYRRLNGRLYLVRDGAFVRDATVGDMTFDHEGRYTTGDAELDNDLNYIVNTYTNDKMGRDEKLRALYVYVRDNYNYLSRPHIEKDQTDWENEYAKAFLQKGKGNCFSYAAAYCLLARQLGHEDAHTIVGTVGHNNRPHGWVEMKLDGATYMFDTELEWSYRYKHKTTKYNFFKMAPNRTPWPYRR